MRPPVTVLIGVSSSLVGIGGGDTNHKSFAKGVDA